MNTCPRLIGAACAAALTLASPARADGAGSEGGFGHMLQARHLLSAGGTRQQTDATIRATAEGFNPAEVGLDDLGVDERDTSYYLEYRYRFSDNWSLLAGGYSYAGSGGRSVERDFNYDGVEFTAGTEIRAEFDIDAYIIDVMYKLYGSDDFELLVGGGLHALDLGASIAGNVRINDFESQFRESGTTLLAPVPNLRVAASWAPTQRLGFTFVGGWLSANVDNYEGAFTYGHLRALLRLGKASAVGLGYQVTDVDITETRARSELNFNVRLAGPTLSFSYAF
jgi:hypothetical protein